MPVLSSSYKPPFWLKNPYIQSILPSLLRKIQLESPHRERIQTPDNDFLDLDWYHQSADQLVIISHGLEGNSGRAYIRGMAKIFTDSDVSALCWNFRGCSGEMNKQFRLYHSAAWDDLETVLLHAIKKGFKRIGLIGFSLGGNVTLKYLGVNAGTIPKEVVGGAGISVPLHLTSSAQELDSPKNKIYMARFLKMLGEKVKAKEAQFPDKISSEGYELIKTFLEFDNRYTAPIHGYKDAADYWNRASSIHELHQINRPVLILSSADDTFLSPACFPEKIASESSFVYLEKVPFGGHVGFIKTGGRPYYSEQRVFEFLQPFLNGVA